MKRHMCVLCNMPHAAYAAGGRGRRRFNGPLWFVIHYNAWAHLPRWSKNKGSVINGTQQKSACPRQKKNNNKGKQWSASPARHLMPIQTYIKKTGGMKRAGQKKSHIFPRAELKRSITYPHGVTVADKDVDQWLWDAEMHGLRYQQHPARLLLQEDLHIGEKISKY